MKIYISHASSYDYENELYQPIRESEAYKHHEFFLPHESQNIDKPAKNVLGHSDLLIAEASYPSTGQGIELGLASAANVRIVCFYRDGAKYSGALRFVTSELIPYKDREDMVWKISALLEQNN